ncbi:MAG: TolC family protein [Gemmatimonadales bacterium]|nr:TolC family protein [Gemmatimonadales bacterium]
MIAAALALALALPGAGDSVPVVTLREAIARAARVDPQYVQAVGQRGNAEWARRQARLAFLVPSLTASIDATKFSQPFFNLGVGRPTDQAVNFRLNAQYELLSLRKFTDLSATDAGLQAAAANAEQQRFTTAFQTERDFYAVLLGQELLRVARERLGRAREQSQVGRARVLSGAAVQSDSLQLTLERTRAESDLLRQEVALRVARLQLGRRIGIDGPADAAPLDTLPAPPLAFGLAEALGAALAQGPQYRQARAAERQTAALLRGQRGAYLPSVNLTGAYTRFDESFFPGGRIVSQVQMVVSLPIWNNGQREIAVQAARVNHDVARAVRVDLERAARRDVSEAHETYEAARRAEELALAGDRAARENFRVQELRYRSGATTILDLIDAQFQLTQADADVAQARYATRLALAGLEVIIGRRLTPEREAM